MSESATGEGPALRAPHSDLSPIREKLDAFCERAILGLVLATLVWAPIAFAGVRLIDFAWVQAMTAAALAFWVVRFWTQRPFRLLWPPVCWGVYAFVAYTIVRAQFADVPFTAHCELVHVITYAVLFFVIVNNLNRRESTEIVTLTLIGLAAALAVFACYQYNTGSPKVSFLFSWAHRDAQYASRGSGTFINPDNFAGFLEMLIPLGLAYVLLSRKSAVVKVVLAYLTVVLIAGLCVTVSRGAMAATALALVALCVALLFGGGYVVPSLIALVVIVGAALLAPGQLEVAERRFQQVGVENGGFFGTRHYYWQTVDKLIQERPLFGFGPAQLDHEWYHVHPPDPRRIIFAHNEYLNTLADYGAAGFAIVAAVVAAVIYGAFRAWRSVRRAAGDLGHRQSGTAAFIVGALFGLVAMLLHCIVDFDMHTPADALLAVALMALLTAQWRFVSERFWMNPGRIGRILLSVAALASTIWLARDSIHLERQQYWYEQAKAEQRFLDQTVDPDSIETIQADARLQAYARKVDALRHACELDRTDAVAALYLAASYWDKAVQGREGYQIDTLLAMQASSWAMLANPLDPYAVGKYGECLEWLDRHSEAGRYFARARVLDPNGWYPKFCEAKHDMELGRLQEARSRFIEAGQACGWNPELVGYVEMVDHRLAEEAKK